MPYVLVSVVLCIVCVGKYGILCRISWLVWNSLPCVLVNVVSCAVSVSMVLCAVCVMVIVVMCVVCVG